MCLIVFSYQQHPDYPLILIANRDESHQRATLSAGFWGSHPNVLGGLDLKAMGTWLGITRQGRFAAVTNFREGIKEPGEHSRGQLTSNFLIHPFPNREYLNTLTKTGDAYSGFNLLFGDIDELFYFSNRTKPETRLSPGLHSLSNHLLNSPWPKAEHAKEQFAALLQKEQLDHESLLSLLQRRETFADERLPDTGVSLEMERTLSAPFIVTPEYGTRCTTLVLWHKDNSIDFIEQNYLPDGTTAERKTFQFNVEK